MAVRTRFDVQQPRACQQPRAEFDFEHILSLTIFNLRTSSHGHASVSARSDALCSGFETCHKTFVRSETAETPRGIHKTKLRAPLTLTLSLT